MLIFTLFKVRARVQKVTFKFKFITWNRGATHNEHSTGEGHSPETSGHWLRFWHFRFIHHFHLTMKLFTAKCHERTTLQKKTMTSNGKLLPAKCWPMLQVIRCGMLLSQESQRVFQNLLLFCFATCESLNDWSIGEQ